ncbi:MAG TPA: hypothetical protein VLJ58_06175, partial [Ramlibacter sp.]|nr:hypothetical protein [Ramlibacter sp.]
AGDDLIVSFPLDQHAQTSLTLLRTPKYESLLDDDERGVSVGTGSDGEGPRELLVSVKWSKDVVEVASSKRHFTLDLAAVDLSEVLEAKAVLRKMNFDKRFEFADV